MRIVSKIYFLPSYIDCCLLLLIHTCFLRTYAYMLDYNLNISVKLDKLKNVCYVLIFVVHNKVQTLF